jgi:hypothetical protein
VKRNVTVPLSDGIESTIFSFFLSAMIDLPYYNDSTRVGVSC